MTEPHCPCPLCHGKQTAFFFHDPKNYRHIYHRCCECDLVFVLPACRLDSQAEKARYDMHHNDESTHYIHFLSRLADPMLTQLAKHAPVHDLEQSPDATTVTTTATNHTGLDFGSGKSQAMAKLFRQAGHTCDCYDVYYYPDTSLQPQSYDFIIACEVIEHLYDPKTVFEQWLSLLKPNGLLGIMTGNRPTDGEFPHWWYKNDPTHVGLYSAACFDYLQHKYRLTTVYRDKAVIIFRYGVYLTT